MHKELADQKLRIALRAGRPCLISSTSFKEGETILCVRSLFFSTADRVRDFMNHGVSSAPSDGLHLRLIRVTGLDSVDGPRSASVFAVPVGAASWLCDHRGIRTFPNCALEVDVSKGPNDGFVKVIAATHNGCGVGANSEVVLNLVQHYVPGGCLEVPPARRFKGPLDLWKEKQLQSQVGRGFPQQPPPRMGRRL